MGNVNLAADSNPDVCVWSNLKKEAAAYATKEVALSSLLHATILDQDSLGGALVNHLSEKLATPDFSTLKLRKILTEAIATDETIVDSAAKDLLAVKDRDPACTSFLQAFLYFKGFMAIQTYRCAHALYESGRDLLAFHLQNRSSELFGVDINPAAKIGHGIMLDHATGTLGGTGKADEDRHPKIGNRVLIGANASVLGNIKIGDSSKIAAGSVVLKPVPENCTVAGVPAKPVGGPCCDNPAKSMVQTL